MPKYATGVGGFRAEFFVLDREAYLRTSEGENGKSKQKYNLMEKTVGFQHQVTFQRSVRAKNVTRKLSFSFLFALMPKYTTPDYQMRR